MRNTSGRRSRTARHRTARHCFTLVELLVVIGIIAVLISILLPSLSRARQSANNIKCQSNLRQIGQGIAMYTVQSKGVLPFGYWDGTTNIDVSPPILNGGASINFEQDWAGCVLSMLNPNAGTQQQNIAGGAQGAPMNSTSAKVFRCPDAPTQDSAVQVGRLGTTIFEVCHYGCNPRLMPALGHEDLFKESVSPGVSYLRPYKYSRIKRAQEVMLVCDASLQQIPLTTAWTCCQVAGNALPVLNYIDAYRLFNPLSNENGNSTWLTDQYGSVPGIATWFTPNSPVDLGTFNFNQDNSANPQNMRYRHFNNTGMNALMVDGHVQKFIFTANRNPELGGQFVRGNLNVNPE